MSQLQLKAQPEIGVLSLVKGIVHQYGCVIAASLLFIPNFGLISHLQARGAAGCRHEGGAQLLGVMLCIVKGIVHQHGLCACCLTAFPSAGKRRSRMHLVYCLRCGASTLVYIVLAASLLAISKPTNGRQEAQPDAVMKVKVKRSLWVLCCALSKALCINTVCVPAS
jgi:hypothetical protein